MDQALRRRHSVLLYQGGCRRGEGPPRIGNVVVGGHGYQGVVGCPGGTAVLGLVTHRADALDAHGYEFELVVETLTADPDNRVQRHLHVRQLLGLFVQEVADHAAQYRLVGHGQDVV